ncbi:hypothetical protein MJG53_018558 [Ovis ammon polii x Ovis aries]|uniref:Uncharacterized protein n=1 Tax=Ovis ammon polii x Ovis aries TaxID=2918886 RepID=A0ACB9U4A0_9CETA|nr:hypothetical protein MJG53_018558 [Ovis ammon polii x Ovis aries]
MVAQPPPARGAPGAASEPVQVPVLRQHAFPTSDGRNLPPGEGQRALLFLSPLPPRALCQSGLKSVKEVVLSQLKMLDTNRNRSDVRERDTGTSPNAAPLQGDAAAYPTTQKGPTFQRKTAPVRDGKCQGRERGDSCNLGSPNSASYKFIPEYLGPEFKMIGFSFPSRGFIYSHATVNSLWMPSICIVSPPFPLGYPKLHTSKTKCTMFP